MYFDTNSATTIVNKQKLCIIINRSTRAGKIDKKDNTPLFKKDIIHNNKSIGKKTPKNKNLISKVQHKY